jgi:hypothetical protein
VSKIHTLLKLQDFKAVSSHLVYLMGASKLREHLRIDIEASYKDIQEIINTKIEKLEKEIESTESYVLLRQQLDLVKAMVANLSPQLSDTNTTMANKLEQLLQNHTEQQYTNTLLLINTLDKEGNCFVEAKQKYLMDLLAYNLNLLVEVEKLFDGCTYYQVATDALDKVLNSHEARFLVDLSKEPVSCDLRLHFKVLKDFNQAQSLVLHTSIKAQKLFSKVEKAYSQL